MSWGSRLVALTEDYVHGQEIVGGRSVGENSTVLKVVVSEVN